MPRLGKSPDQGVHSVLETLGGPEFGTFERDDEGNISFIRTGAKTTGSGMAPFLSVIG